MEHEDERIRQDVLNQLHWDSRIDASRIEVTVTNGRVVLSGTVPTYQARRLASMDTSILPGVVSVENQIDVELVLIPADNTVRARATRVLHSQSEFDASDIDISVSGGHLTLEGSVREFWEKIRCNELLSAIEGVVGIKNKLVVVPSKDIVDEKIGEEILAALERNANVDAGSVDVTVQNSAVVLSGTVPSWAARHAAYKAALFTSGVIDVQDKLVVSPETESASR
jgi:osmotically-inducible protein OsmY